MVRRRLRCKLFIVIWLAVLGVLIFIYKWPVQSGDNLQFRKISGSPTSWWLPWRNTRGSCKGSNFVKFPEKPSKNVLDTNELYGNLDFSVQPGNRFFWNRTFEENYLRFKSNAKKGLPLEVIMVPHSHTDPGWLKTYDEYFHGYVTRILDNMVKFLNETSDFTFIWSEVSYFSDWWKTQKSEVKATVIELLRKRRFEIVTGGWVMTDEATAHYWAMIDQLIEGHQWLKSTTGVIPTYAWSVDIFGHSLTMPSLLLDSNMKGMVVLRTHYAWKSFLARIRGLDFHWENNMRPNDILCHMAPSDLYAIKHTCGPDPSVCLQYDFRSIRGEFSESIATEINAENLAAKAKQLLGQFERYAYLYPHNVLLVPLGDDFRYDRPIEWNQQYRNYKQLFSYINRHKELDAHVRFGTVSSYFEEVERRLRIIPGMSLPSVTGDFFPYADIYSDGVPSYWTGYYSTRPFYKSLTRELEHWLRTAEILYSLALPKVQEKDQKRLIADYVYLMSARQSLALFQHHDAITGTAKFLVMEDYGLRLHAAIKESISIVSHSCQHLMLPRTPKNIQWTSKINPDVVRTHPEMLKSKIVISIPQKGRRIILFNSLTLHRREVVRVKVKTPYVRVLNRDGVVIPCQVNPVWSDAAGMMSSIFELIFVCDIEPLTFSVYTLIRVAKEEWDSSSRAEVSFLIGDKVHKGSSGFLFKQEKQSDITLASSNLKAKFTENGLLKEVYLHKQGVEKRIGVDFYVHLSKPHLSGAYLFNPSSNGPVNLSKITEIYPLARIVRGSIVSEITFNQQPYISLTTRIYHFDGALDFLDLDVQFNIFKMNPGTELVMRVNSDIRNAGDFYTDANGFQMVKRKYVSKLPIQGNYYPVTSSAYLENMDNRLNLFTSHSHGLTSPTSGTLEVMLDRRTEFDDGRGLSEGVLDNKLTSSNFRLLLEPSPGNSAVLVPSLTSTAYISSMTMLYPLTTFIMDSTYDNLVSNRLSFTKNPWPLGTHLVNLRTLPSEKDFSLPSTKSLLVILRQPLACESMISAEHDYNVRSLLVNVTSFEKTSLTGVHKIHADKSSHNFNMLESYNVHFHVG